MCHHAVRRIRDVRDQVEALTRRLDESGRGEGVDESAAALLEKLEAVEERLTQTKARSSQDVLNFPPKLDAQFLGLLGVVGSADARPTDGSVERQRDLEAELDRHRNDLERILRTELAAFNDLVRGKNVGPVIVPPRAAGDP
jgi:hypothetical protein